MSDTTPFPDAPRPVDPRPDQRPGPADPTVQTAGPGPAMPVEDATAPLTQPFGSPPLTPAGGTPPSALPGADLEATVPLMPAVGGPASGAPYPGGVATPPGGWPPADAGTPPWAQGQPPYPQAPYGQPPYAQGGYGQAPGWGGAPYPQDPYGQPMGGTYAGGDPAADGWGPEDGPQAGTAYGTRPPTPPSGIRRGGAAGGDGGSRGPSAILVGSVIGVAALVAVAVWMLMFRPGSETASATPTPGATTFVTPPPTATPEGSFSFDPSPAPTRFRNPTFAGLRVTDAQALADQTGIRIEVTYEVTEEVDPDTVIDQDPAPGEELGPGDVVRLTVAAPAPTVAIPDLRGFAEEDAIAALLDAGLGIGERTEAYDEDTAAGLIIRTDPRGGISVARETLIDYLVSLGPEPLPSATPAPTELPAPGFVGLTAEDAQALADEWGLVLDVREQETLDAEAGTVLSQDPEPDSPILPGSTVVLVVAVQPATVLVPDVRDLAEADAVSALLDAGLAPGTRTEAFDAGVEAGTVIRTDPRQGVAVAPGTVVDYLVSLGAEPTPSPSAAPELVSVPDVTGLPVEEAQAIVEDAGLVLATEDRETLEVEPGVVLDQDPPVDTLLPAGSTVRAVLSVRPSSIAVPPLRGQSEADAVAALRAAALVPGERTERYHGSVPAGAVIRSDPAGGTIVALDTTVDYVLSLGPEPTPSPSPTPAQVDLPELSGVAIVDVQAFADENGIVLDIVDRETDEAPDGTVLEQDPAAGSRVGRGDTVRVTVARRPANVTVPTLRGAAEADAISALLDADLVPGDRSERFHPTVPAGAVILSDPRAGVSVPRGSAVAYTVSLGAEPTPNPTPTPSPTPEPTPAPILVPSFIGGPVGDAQAFADANGLVTDITSQETADAPPDLVLDQDPRDGAELRPGDTLRLVVATPLTTTAVPAVRGLLEADAVSEILDAGLTIGSRQERFHGSVPAGAVIRTDPPIGEVLPLGSAVDLLVSKGPEPTPSPTPEPTQAPIDVPSLVGGTRGDAEAFADANRIDLQVAEQESTDAAPDTILDQDPREGTRLRPGDTLRVLVAIAPTQVTVPTLRGLSEADGIALLVDAGLTPGRRIERFNEAVAADLIVRTDPAADATVPAGTVVDYVVSKGAEPIPAPTFVGLAIDDAQALASGSGLTLDVTEQDDDSVPTGTVLSQDPPAGEPLTGTTVAVVTARNTALATVPALRGQTEADAIALLVDAGLNPGRRLERFNDAIAAGLVVRTDPAADAQVAPGTAVDYVISKGPEPQPVPDVTGLPLGDADGVARDNGLTLDISYQDTLDTPPDTILSQDPPAGQPGDGSGTIRVTVSRAPTSVVIPRLRGVAEADAISALLDAGLTIGDRSERANPTIPAGSLLSTEPRGDTEVAPGTPIDYVVSTGPNTSTPEPTPEPTREPRPTPVPTDNGGNGGDPVSLVEPVIGQVAAIRELEQLAGVPVRSVGQRELRQAIRAATPASPGLEARTLERLGLIPAGTDLVRTRLDLLANGTVAFYDPASRVLMIRDGALDAVLRFFAAGEADRALIDQNVGLGFLAPDDPTQTDRATARAALLGGDQSLVMIDWAGQQLGPDEQAQLPGLISTDPTLVDAAPLYLRRMLTFPTQEGLAFVQSIRDAGGWAAVADAYARPPASTEQILHPEKFRADRPVAVELPDPSGALGGGWSVIDTRTMGELGIGVWLDDGADGSPNAWAADGWGGDRLVTLDGPDGSWIVVWQTAWDSDTDADEFAGMADQAMADLPGAHVVLRGADLAGDLPSPALVIVASDQSVIDTFLSGSGLGS